MKSLKIILALLLGFLPAVASAQVEQFQAWQIWGNPTAAQALPTAGSIGAILDGQFACSAQGSIIQRGSSAWGCLAPGTIGLPLLSGGAGANVAYAKLAVSNIANGSLDTVIGYFGAIVTNAITIPNCANSLTYSTTTHIFGCNVSAGTGTVTSVTCGTGLSGGTFTVSGTCAIVLPKFTNSLGADVTLNNSTYSLGPTVAQGTSGTWFASGKVTLADSAASQSFLCKLWDGTTVIDSGKTGNVIATASVTMTLSGYLTTPAANIEIRCLGTAVGATSAMQFNVSGNSKDSTLSVFRIQ